MITLVEIQIDDDVQGWLLVIFGGSTACVVGCMLVAMLNSTLMLVAILKYDCVKREVSEGPGHVSFHLFCFSL